MVAAGFKWEINFIGIVGYKTGNLSLQQWFTYDASIGLGQVLNLKNALLDANPLTGTGLVSFAPNLASSCGATNDEQVISCIHSVASSVPGFNYEWYIYDEPGCPNQSIGYCAGSIAGHNYSNVQTLANYIASIDPTHAVRGVQTPGGCAGGCSAGNNAATEATAVDNLFSWITNSTTPNTGFDYDPIPSNIINNDVDDIGVIAGDIANEIKANYPAETMTFTVQAFSWLQEGWSTCTSISVCPYPTTAQMQDMRDQALYYANKAGKPLSRLYWYYWPDITCEGASTYAGCNSSANLASVKAAMSAPFPATPPP
jgi:hypothetical protein